MNAEIRNRLKIRESCVKYLTKLATRRGFVLRQNRGCVRRHLKTLMDMRGDPQHRFRFMRANIDFLHKEAWLHEHAGLQFFIEQEIEANRQKRQYQSYYWIYKCAEEKAMRVWIAQRSTFEEKYDGLREAPDSFRKQLLDQYRAPAPVAPRIILLLDEASRKTKSFEQRLPKTIFEICICGFLMWPDLVILTRTCKRLRENPRCAVTPSDTNLCGVCKSPEAGYRDLCFGRIRLCFVCSTHPLFETISKDDARRQFALQERHFRKLDAQPESWRLPARDVEKLALATHGSVEGIQAAVARKRKGIEAAIQTKRAKKLKLVLPDLATAFDPFALQG